MSDFNRPHGFVVSDDDPATCNVCGYEYGHLLHAPPSIDELREPLASELEAHIARLAAAAEEQNENVRGLTIRHDALRRQCSEMEAKAQRLEGAINRFENEGTGLSAEIIRVIEHASQRGFVDVCISSPEPMVDASGQRIGTSGWVITLGKGQS